MNDQDFFFEEESNAKASAAKGSKASAKAPAKSSVTAPARTSSKAAPRAAANDPVAADQSTTWAVAVLIGVIGLLLGAILGFMLGSTIAKSTAVAPAAASSAASSSSEQAPALSSDQISAGQLPAGHPAVNVSGTSDTTSTGN